MSKFTDRLWRELVREHGADLAQMDSLAPAAHRWRARPRLLAGTSLGAAALATAAAVIFAVASSSPAFAVTRNHDGTYTVQIHSWSAIGAANRALHGMDLRAVVVAVNVSCGGTMPAPTPQPVPRAMRLQLEAQARPETVIAPRRIPAGKTLVIGAWRSGHQVRVASAAAVTQVPVCLPPPCVANSRVTPPPGNFQSGNSGNSGNSGSQSTTGASQTALKPNTAVRAWSRVRSAGASQTALKPNTAVQVWCPKPGTPAGNGGNSGNSGSGNSGNS
ncbi:MAG: hypothetical protein ACLP8S_26745 [Solirubrobacteraceae bacterium]